MSITTDTKDNLGVRDDTRTQVVKRINEKVQLEENATRVRTNTLGNSWIVGSKTNGIVGTNTGTQGGGQQVVGGSARVEAVQKVVNPNDTYREHFLSTRFKDTTNTTSTWSTTGSATFTGAGSAAVSLDVYKDSTTISSCDVELTASDTRRIIFYLSADGGTNYEHVTLSGDYDGLAAYYKLNAASGSANVIDSGLYGLNGTSSGYSDLNGTDTNITYSSDDPLGGTNQSAGFNGTDSKIVLPSAIAFTNGMTLLFWAKATSKDYAGLFDGNLGTYSYLRFGFGAGTSLNRIGGETDTNGDTIELEFDSNLTDDNWYHFAIQLDSGSNLWKIWVDGVEQTDTATTTDNTMTIRQFGTERGGSVFYDKEMAYIRIYDTELTTTEIQAEMNSAYPIKGDSLIHSWDLNGDSNDAPWRVTGKIDEAFSFDGTGTKIALNDESKLTRDFSVSMWFKLNVLPTVANSNMGLIGGNGLAGGAPEYGFALTFYGNGASPNDKLFFDTYDGTDRKSTVSTTTNWGTSWHHVVATRDMDGNQELWIDGTREDYDASTGNPLDWSSSTTWTIGYSALGYFDGLIDEVQMYGRVLSSTEIATLYNSGAPTELTAPSSSTTDSTTHSFTTTGTALRFKAVSTGTASMTSVKLEYR